MKANWNLTHICLSSLMATFRADFFAWGASSLDGNPTKIFLLGGCSTMFHSKHGWHTLIARKYTIYII